MNQKCLIQATSVTILLLLLTVASPPCSASGSADQNLQGHWDFNGNYENSASKGQKVTLHGGGPVFGEDQCGLAESAIEFDGIDDWLEVAFEDPFGKDDFTLAGWFRVPETIDDAAGDLVSLYEPETHHGINLTLQSFAGVASSESNKRNLLFGLDADRIDSEWTDCGRPGNAILAYSLAVFDGSLYVGTYEEGADEAGTVYRYLGGNSWESCGNPDKCNSVTSLCVFQGALYAAVSKYNAEGSSLMASPNIVNGGKVYRYNGGKSWTDCGRLGNAEYIFGMAEFENHLYATLIHSPNPSRDLTDLGLYRYEGGDKWVYCGNPGGRVCAIAPHNGKLYGSGYDAGQFGGVFRYEGDSDWTNCGVPGNTDQTYSFASYWGDLHVGTWPEAKVYRYIEDNKWEDKGRLGKELEVMGMAVYNGQLFGGTLPLAQVYRFMSDTKWSLTGRLDPTPDVKYRRAWTMAVYDGRLFCGTLPSGHVYSLESGIATTYDKDLGTGWKHITAVRKGAHLSLYVNGSLVSSSHPFDKDRYDLGSISPLRIGFGPQGHFKGRISDLRIYRGALDEQRINNLYTSTMKN